MKRLVFLLLVSCGGRVPPPAIVTTPCVLHSGNASGRRDASGKVSGSCSFDAECFTVPGQTAPGDGFVRLVCEDLACTCEQRSAGDDRVSRTTFTIPEACADEDAARRLFLDHCMVGLKLYEGP